MLKIYTFLIPFINKIIDTNIHTPNINGRINNKVPISHVFTHKMMVNTQLIPIKV